VGSRFSSTHRSAQLAAARSERRVGVVDSTTVAGAEGLVVLAAAEAARRGADLDEVERVARRAAEDVRLVALVPDLGAIARSGRLSDAVVRLAGRARVRVVIELARGRIRPLRPRIGGDPLDPLMARWRASRRRGSLDVAALHALDEPGALQLLERVSREFAPRTSFVAPFAASMIAHTGPGLLGLAWRWAA
jgi:DegV family protein with EDD domain